MKYIDQILQPDEKLVYSTKIHWVVYLPGVGLWLVAFAMLGFAANAAGRPLWSLAALIVMLIAASSTFRAWFRRWTTEIDVTDRRIIYKRGFIRRHTVEMNMDKVESVDVDQSFLGRILNYGNIIVRGTGSGIEPLHNVATPLRFRSFVTAR